MDERENRLLLEQWIERRGGNAKITGKKALNLNPLITADESGHRELHLAWWWVHVGNEPATFSAFNARDDKLLSSRVWKTPFREHRALAPATWYVEKGKKFALPGGEAFGIASITTTAYRGDEKMLTYALVTRDAVEAAATVHPRMPLVLPAKLHDDWLDTELTGDGDLLAEALTASEELSRSMVIVVGDDGQGEKYG
ncbi:SOS response-associated peptidase family protein [Corynebacterium kalidii]|uniref:Abasic site processing protein n=1 Tax=Corynebacterium kalidii TaxID=2931982 RepID=A0A9X1WH57_9CORY|nr:SOS response-associated peptidase family protein [Corynebacterium kalidii]MCJ7858954.1 SOS response-associated peptidase [Corynebacterium kalidii]